MSDISRKIYVVTRRLDSSSTETLIDAAFTEYIDAHAYSKKRTSMNGGIYKIEECFLDKKFQKTDIIYQYNSIDLTQYFINKLIKANIKFNITKLMRMMYINYGIHLLENNIMILEQPICMPYGPVFESIHSHYAKKNLGYYEVNVKVDKNLDDIMDKTIDLVGHYDSKELSIWSRREGSAWKKIHDQTEFWGRTLSNEDIRKEFTDMISAS